MKVNKSNISVDFLTIDGKKMTISFFRQIEECSLCAFYENRMYEIIGYVNHRGSRFLVAYNKGLKCIERAKIILDNGWIEHKNREANAYFKLRTDYKVIPQLFIGR